MEELKIIYDIITSAWKLVKKYGCNRLTDKQWDSFVENGKRDREIYHGKGEIYDLFYRGMFSVVQDYYIQKNSKG